LIHNTKSIFYFANILRTIGADDFLKEYDHPFLLLVSQPTDGEGYSAHVVDRTTETGISSQPTMKVPNDTTVIELIKSDRNEYKSKITLGRAKINDIIIEDVRISKVHTFFFSAQNKSIQVMDAGSSNKTKIDTKVLESHKQYPINDGDSISFWKYTFVFLTPNGFIKILKSLPD
jgi:hypothetical protein